VAVGHPGGTGVVALPTEVQPPAAVWPDGAGDPDRRAGPVRQRAALLDVQLDKGVDAGQPLGIRPDSGRPPCI